MERNVNELSDLRARNKIQIDRLNETVDRNNQVINDQELNIKSLHHEKNSLQKRYDDLAFENNSNISKLRAKEDALLHTKNQLEETSKNLNKQNVSFSFNYSRWKILKINQK